MAATQHYPLRPKSDLVLLYGLANLLIQLKAVDRAFVETHTTGFEDFVDFVRSFSVSRVADETGLSEEKLWRLAGTIAEGKRVSFWWTMGVNQSHESTRTAQALINLALMTGNIGRPGTGANSITGQCNAMGSRLFANVTSLIGEHDATCDADRAKVARVLGLSEDVIPRQPSMAYDQIVEGIESGTIKALWVIATNSSHSWVQQDRFNALMAKLDLLVVQDMFSTTETASHAHLFLPAAGWGEKEGTLINSERRIGLVKKVRVAPGQALADFHIFRLIAHSWGCGAMFSRWSSPEAAFQLLKELSRGKPYDITGIADYRMLDEWGGIQWPLAETDSDRADIARDRRLFGDGRFYTPDGRACFHFEEPRPLPEKPDADYPFLLLTGRGTSSQWHTNTRTGKSAVLRKLYPPDCYGEIHPEDASRLGIEPGERMTITSRRASLTAWAFVTPSIQPGQIFLPMHYREVNRLTSRFLDSHSRQPSYKASAVRVEKAG